MSIRQCVDSPAFSTSPNVKGYVGLSSRSGRCVTLSATMMKELPCVRWKSDKGRCLVTVVFGGVKMPGLVDWPWAGMKPCVEGSLT